MRADLIVMAGLAAVLTAGPASSQTSASQRGTLLATVTISHAVLVNGQPLPPGTHLLRLTGEWYQPLVEGGQQGMQWVEFMADGNVVGRELVLVIPAREIGAISEWHPAQGTSRVDLLKGGEFVRIWTNRGGTNYSIHLPVRR